MNMAMVQSLTTDELLRMADEVAITPLERELVRRLQETADAAAPALALMDAIDDRVGWTTEVAAVMAEMDRLEAIEDDELPKVRGQLDDTLAEVARLQEVIEELEAADGR